MATKRKKSILMLPELQDVSITQPNRVTKAYYNYNLTQEKIFTLVMYQLQDQIKRVTAGTTFNQLDLFSNAQDTHTITIPLNMLSASNNYKKVRQSAEQMTGIQLRMNDLQKKETTVAGLFGSVTSPQQHKGGVMQIVLLKKVCELLMSIDTKYSEWDKRQIPVEYTNYKLAVVYQCKNKYTPRLHRFISSWKGKQHVPPMTIESFREYMQLNPGQYENFNDVKKRILDPVNAELREYGDCWFNYGVELEHKRVSKINFFVVTPKSEEYYTKQMNFAKKYIVDNFRLEKSFMDQLEWIFTDKTGNIHLDDVIYKANKIKETILTRRDIGDPKKYAFKALYNAFLEFKPSE